MQQAYPYLQGAESHGGYAEAVLCGPGYKLNASMGKGAAPSQFFIEIPELGMRLEVLEDGCLAYKKDRHGVELVQFAPDQFQAVGRLSALVQARNRSEQPDLVESLDLSAWRVWALSAGAQPL